MKKKVAVVTVAEAEEASRVADLPVEATVALAEVAGAIKDGLMAFASATGLVVMYQMMEAELEDRIGPKHARIPAAERTGNWHGSTEGPVVLGGRTVTTKCPRGRTTDGGEIELDTWKAFSSADLLNSLVVERMLVGWLPDGMVTWPNRWAPTSTRRPAPPRSRPSPDVSSRPPRRRWRI